MNLLFHILTQEVSTTKACIEPVEMTQKRTKENLKTLRVSLCPLWQNSCIGTKEQRARLDH
jgi:hypothetical protein